MKNKIKQRKEEQENIKKMVEGTPFQKEIIRKVRKKFTDKCPIVEIQMREAIDLTLVEVNKKIDEWHRNIWEKQNEKSIKKGKILIGNLAVIVVSEKDIEELKSKLGGE